MPHDGSMQPPNVSAIVIALPKPTTAQCPSLFFMFTRSRHESSRTTLMAPTTSAHVFQHGMTQHERNWSRQDSLKSGPDRKTA